MSLNGNASANTLYGSVSTPKAIQGLSAFEIALIHGFKGTEEEWLASLKGIDGIDGIGAGDMLERVYDSAGRKTDIYKYTDDAVALIGEATNNKLSLSGGAMTGPITLNGEPTEDLHPATKKYVDDALGGISIDESFELINTVTTSSAVTSVAFTTDSNGNAFQLKKMFISMSTPSSVAKNYPIWTFYVLVTGQNGKTRNCIRFPNATLASPVGSLDSDAKTLVITNGQCLAELYGGLAKYYMFSGSFPIAKPVELVENQIDTIAKVEFISCPHTSEPPFAPGTVINLYGVRA